MSTDNEDDDYPFETLTEAELENALKHAQIHRPFIDFINTQIGWSKRTFGTKSRGESIPAHILKELLEIRDSRRAGTHAHTLTEWCDVMILAIEGAWREGFSPEEIVEALAAKQAKNATRVYPPPVIGKPCEHSPGPKWCPSEALWDTMRRDRDLIEKNY